MWLLISFLRGGVLWLHGVLNVSVCPVWTWSISRGSGCKTFQNHINIDPELAGKKTGSALNFHLEHKPNKYKLRKILVTFTSKAVQNWHHDFPKSNPISNQVFNRFSNDFYSFLAPILAWKSLKTMLNHSKSVKNGLKWCKNHWKSMKTVKKCSKIVKNGLKQHKITKNLCFSLVFIGFHWFFIDFHWFFIDFSSIFIGFHWFS